MLRLDMVTRRLLPLKVLTRSTNINPEKFLVTSGKLARVELGDTQWLLTQRSQS